MGNSHGSKVGVLRSACRQGFVKQEEDEELSQKISN